MRRTVSAYVDHTRQEKLADVPCHLIGEGVHDMPDDILIGRARSWMRSTGQLQGEHAETAFLVVEEGG